MRKGFLTWFKRRFVNMDIDVTLMITVACISITSWSTHHLLA